MPRVLADLDVPDRPEGEFRAELAGRHGVGRQAARHARLQAVTQAKTAVGEGATTDQALAQGGNWLDLMTKLQVADAARQAVGILTASRKNLGGTVRVLNPPSCQRCAILAGRFYRWSTGFDRHPRCDCTNLPVPSRAYAEAEGFVTNPMDAYRTRRDQGLDQGQKFALDNGADISQVVNATRGMSPTSLRRRTRTTRATPMKPAPGVTPGMPDLMADILGAQRSKTIAPLGDLTPEGIYRTSKTRDEAISLLREVGYIR